MFATKINAPNDVNGNPQRGWIIHTERGIPNEFVREGYDGWAALEDAHPGILSTAVSIEVTQAEYRRWARGVKLVAA